MIIISISATPFKKKKALEVVPKLQIRFEGKALTDEKSQHTW
jgi:hypothetical protein